MKPYSLFLQFAAFFSSLFFVFSANAAGVGDFSKGSFNVKLTPETPAPSQEVTAEVISNAINANSVPITWILNGKTTLQGIGKKTFTFTTSKAGVLTSLRVEVTTGEFGVVSKDIEIQPSDVDILWETDTYTPPFYRGKALPSSQSFIKMIGIPHFGLQGREVDSSDLIYRWKKTYVPNPNDAGRGKNVYIFRGGYTFNDDIIETTVSTADGSISFGIKTKVPIREPKVILYEDKPTEGVRYENALMKSLVMRNKEVVLRAEPFFFSVKDADHNDAIFTWSIDGKKYDSSLGKKSEFTLRKPGSGSGSVGVSVKIENRERDFQTASKNILLSY